MILMVKSVVMHNLVACPEDKLNHKSVDMMYEMARSGGLHNNMISYRIELDCLQYPQQRAINNNK
jgi:hypothetical protein